jgi:hypothetical protein
VAVGRRAGEEKFIALLGWVVVKVVEGRVCNAGSVGI